MTVATPNTSNSGTVGTPSPAPVATESLDSSVTAALTDHVQQFSLVNVLGWLRSVLGSMAQAWSLAADPGSGRIRVSLENVGPPGSAVAMTSSGVPVTMNANTSLITVANISAISGGGNKPDTMIFDIMQTAWATSVYPCILRS